jgi:hypothetical protein
MGRGRGRENCGGLGWIKRKDANDEKGIKGDEQKRRRNEKIKGNIRKKKKNDK